MANKIYWSKTALIGGTADALDSIDGAGLTDGDFAHVVVGEKLYIYKLDGDSGATESSPDVITPDANAGTKRWILIGKRTTGKIKARAYRNAAQNINAASGTKVLIDTISFDTEGVVDTTNSRITPSLPGYYQVSAQVFIKGIPDGGLIVANIFKNGIGVSGGSGVRGGALGVGGSVVSDLIYMNGTTDYLELYAYNSHTSALELDVGQPIQNRISIVGPF